MSSPTKPLKSYRDLIAWQRAMSLVDAVLALTAIMQADKAPLKAQMERAAISIAANIAEGYGRSGRREYLHFLSIAAASLRELETFLEIVHRNSLASPDKLRATKDIAEETGRVLGGLRRALKSKGS